ncbi:hypothetical protein [Mycolicibacterium parafortuitum]|nr:hypothetical protein [Mycolicibacterium parafortuitum]
MDSSELFSHLPIPQVLNTDTRSNEPVQAPVFSDAPKRTAPRGAGAQ